MRLSRTVSALRFLPSLQTNKLACHRFRDTGEHPRLLGQKQRTSWLTAIVVARVLTFPNAGSLSPDFQNQCREGQVTPEHTEIHHKRGIQSLGNQIWNNRQQACLHSALRKALSYEDSQEQRAVTHCSQGMQVCDRPVGSCLPTTAEYIYGNWAHCPLATPKGKGWGSRSTGRLVPSFVCCFLLVSIMIIAHGGLLVDFGTCLTFCCM